MSGFGWDVPSYNCSLNLEFTLPLHLRLHRVDVCDFRHTVFHCPALCQFRGSLQVFFSIQDCRKFEFVQYPSHEPYYNSYFKIMKLQSAERLSHMIDYIMYDVYLLNIIMFHDKKTEYIYLCHVINNNVLVFFSCQ